MRQLIVADHDPENVILMEIDPEHQKTLPDFLVTQRRARHRHRRHPVAEEARQEAVSTTKNGREVEVRRIYNRCIVDELERKGITLAVRSARRTRRRVGRPSQLVLPHQQVLHSVSESSVVPKTWFLDQLAELPPDNENYLLKPLYSFAGVGIKFAPTNVRHRRHPSEQRHDYILQERMQLRAGDPDAARPDADGNSHDVCLARTVAS